VSRASAGDSAEFERVTRDSVIISLWVDGNFKAWKRKRAEQRRGQEGYQNRFVLPAATVEKNSKKQVFEFRNNWTLSRSTPCGGFMYYARGNRMVVQ
jgi:hypothetical protein